MGHGDRHAGAICPRTLLPPLTDSLDDSNNNIDTEDNNNYGQRHSKCIDRLISMMHNSNKHSSRDKSVPHICRIMGICANPCPALSRVTQIHFC